jgi:hypothetical protein
MPSSNLGRIHEDKHWKLRKDRELCGESPQMCTALKTKSFSIPVAMKCSN